MSKYLDLAIELALRNVEEGGTPYGSVVVKDGNVIGEGVNTLHITPDISGHAELVAIRQAQQRLGRVDLSDCTVYASGHPCPMCLGSIALSGIKKVVYANSVEDAANAGMPLTKNIYQYLNGDHEAINIEIIHEPIVEDSKNPMIAYSKKKNLEA